MHSFAKGGEAATKAVAKSTSKIWKKLKPYKKDIKTNGLKGKKKEYYKWDDSHGGEIEVYDRLGVHKGVIDPTTGEKIKPAVPGRNIKI